MSNTQKTETGFEPQGDKGGKWEPLNPSRRGTNDEVPLTGRADKEGTYEFPYRRRKICSNLPDN